MLKPVNQYGETAMALIPCQECGKEISDKKVIPPSLSPLR